MAVDEHQDSVEVLAGTRGYVVLTICEDDTHLFVRAAVYDGRPESLKTPENIESFTTTREAREWARSYAEDFLREVHDDEPDECFGDDS